MDDEQAPTTVRPTKKQRELLDFIAAFIAAHGYSPSYREIMNGLQYNSVATVALHVGNLIKRGHLHKRGHSARSLEVVGVQPEAGIGPASGAAKPNKPADGHETWLAGQMENYVRQAAAASRRDPEKLYEAETDGMVLLRALELLGLSGRSEGLQAALAELQQLSANDEKDV